MARTPPEEHDRTDELRELARYARQRHELYKARSYGPRETSASRLRDLERESRQAQARLDAYIADRARRAQPR